ncbi:MULTISPECIES: heme exporter protein CcmD [Sediminimonas]|uniref:heme exporter protein CcmD n=1 Tax=Sediminimonas TaxID=659427 RepID=UPI000424F4F0|nr:MULTISPECIES: heme exporter protein CcmD [Sediminimonas]MDR9484037.1 heme exporter protein CcmD [Sediminimonas sp.]
MMPDLGKYAEAVLSSYAISIALLAVLVIASVVRARRVKRDLESTEKRGRNHAD